MKKYLKMKEIKKKRQIYKKIVKQRQEWKVDETEKLKNLTQRI